MLDAPLRRRPETITLAVAETCEVHDEFCRREGVEARWVGPTDSYTVDVDGPCWVIVNRD